MPRSIRESLESQPLSGLVLVHSNHLKNSIALLIPSNMSTDGCLFLHGSGVQFVVTHTTGGYDGNFPTGFGMFPCHSRECAVPVTRNSAATLARRVFFI